MLIIVKDNKIYVANCGDTQASLFSCLNQNEYKGKCLNNIHNASQEEEKKKLIQEHSNENDIIVSRRGSNVFYVKGVLQCTRVYYYH